MIGLLQSLTSVLQRHHIFRWIIIPQQSIPTVIHTIKLGRWNHPITKEQMERRIDLANTDNCAYHYFK